MSAREPISLRDDIVNMTSELLVLLSRIGCIAFSEDLEKLLRNTLTLPDINEVIRHPDKLRVLHEYFTDIRSWFLNIGRNTTAAISELESVRKQLSKLLNDLDVKLNALRSLTRTLNGISSID